ncbi:MAG: hypothetical protein H7Z42_19530 [Roseiflexaceae bacterium]|nr:hypothetical protein [Roseiflexaceae bacterium]
MAYLLLILFPVAMAACTFLLRTQTRFVLLAATATALAELALLTAVPVDGPARLLGLTLVLDPLSRLFLAAFFVIAAVAFAAALKLPHGENFVPIGLLLLTFTAATLLLLQEPFVVALLLISAAVLAVLAVIDLPTGSPLLVGRSTLAAALKYLVLMVVSGVVLYLAFVLVSIYEDTGTAQAFSATRLILALIAVGFGLRLAMVPFHSWLPDLAEHAAPMVTMLIITVINITSLLVLVSTLQYFGPIILFDNDLAIATMQALGVATALLGAVLALGQDNLRRALGYLVVYDAGMVLYGLTTLTSVGLAGALFEAFNQIAVVMLLFLSLSLLEQPDGRPSNVPRRDLLRRWPVAGVGFLVGGLALLGLPPFNGFASKLLIYQAAAQSGGPALVLLLLSTVVALLALGRVAYERLLGPSEDAASDQSPLLLGETDLDRLAPRALTPEPRGLAVIVCALIALCLVVGLYPQPVLATINDVIQGLTFIRA